MGKYNAYFDNMADASKALKSLKEAGFRNAHLDLAGFWDYEYSQEISRSDVCNNLPKDAVTEEDIQECNAMYSAWSRYLNSGMSNSAKSGAHFGLQEHETKIGTRLVLTADEDSKAGMEKIIKEHGGRILSTFMEL